MTFDIITRGEIRTKGASDKRVRNIGGQRLEFCLRPVHASRIRVSLSVLMSTSSEHLTTATSSSLSMRIPLSSASISSMVGRLPFRSFGRTSVRRVSQSATPSGLGEVSQGVLDDHPVLALAKQQADSGRVVGVAHQVVHGGEVQVHLANESGAERDRLELDYDEAAQSEVVEQQIHVKVAVADLQEHLSADEGESGPHLQQEALDVVHETLLQLPFRARLGGAEEVEQVRVLECLRGQIGVRRWQRPGESW